VSGLIIKNSIKESNQLSEYEEIATCDEMKNRFAIDLKNKEIKYFDFGLGTNIQLQNVLESRYEIEYLSMGCIIRSEMECYNKLVEDYLMQNYNKSIDDLIIEHFPFEIPEEEISKNVFLNNSKNYNSQSQ
jgi:hypothetical protein